MALSKNEYDRADFKGVYEGKSLLQEAEITNVPWEIGEAQPIVCQILDSRVPGRLLDVGCGLGRNAKAAANRGYQVMAIDISPAAIEKCRTLHVDTKISFHVSDVCHSSLAPGFDVILDSATYHAIPSDQRLAYLTEMRRLATENTLFHIITFAPSQFGMPKPLANELSDIASNVEKSGWQIKSVERVEYKGNAAAITDFQKKKNLQIKIDEKGRTRLPAWHLTLQILL
jgi:ubiquinone/menaquinone biosynthesis C-methylase UbiE